MQVTVVALMCHALASIPQPLGREEIVIKDEMPMQACMLCQAALADWKAHSIYASEQWAIGRIKCVPGDTSSRGRSDAGQPAITVKCSDEVGGSGHGAALVQR